MTKQTAATFGLRVGSKVQVTGPMALAANGGVVTFQVSGIVIPVDPDSSFWTVRRDRCSPRRWRTRRASARRRTGSAAVIAGPAEAVAVQPDFGAGRASAMQWGFPLALGSVTGQQARPLSDALTSLSAQTPRLSGDVAPVSPTLSVSSGLLTTLAAYFATAQSVDALLWLLWVSLAVTGVAVLLLTARMVALRRSAEFAVVRARGASLWQLALAAGRAAAVVCVPAAVIGDRARRPRRSRRRRAGRRVRGRLVAAGRHPRRRGLRPGRGRGLAAPAAAPPARRRGPAAGVARGPGYAW